MTSAPSRHWPPRQPERVLQERRAHGCRQGARANSRPISLWGSGPAAWPPGGGQYLPARLWPSGLHKTSETSVQPCATAEDPQAALSSAFPRLTALKGCGRPGGTPGLAVTFQGHATRMGTAEGPRAVPGCAVRLLASLGPGRPAARRLKGDCYLHSVGGSAFSPSPYGYFLWTCSALLGSLSELSHIKNHLTYNNRFKRRQSIIS